MHCRRATPPGRTFSRYRYFLRQSLIRSDQLIPISIISRACPGLRADAAPARRAFAAGCALRSRRIIIMICGHRSLLFRHCFFGPGVPQAGRRPGTGTANCVCRRRYRRVQASFRLRDSTPLRALRAIRIQCRNLLLAQRRFGITTSLPNILRRTRSPFIATIATLTPLSLNTAISRQSPFRHAAVGPRQIWVHFIPRRCAAPLHRAFYLHRAPFPGYSPGFSRTTIYCSIIIAVYRVSGRYRHWPPRSAFIIARHY